MSRYINIYSVIFVYIVIGVLRFLFFLHLPEYNTDAVWTASGAYANLRHEWISDGVAGFRFPNLYSYLLSGFIVITGNTYYSLQLWYLFIQTVSAVAVYHLLYRKNTFQVFSAFLLSLLFYTDVLVSNCRPECLGMLFLIYWIGIVRHFYYKHALGILLAFVIHPVTLCVYIFYLIAEKQVSYKMLLVGIAAVGFLLAAFYQQTYIWLETLVLRLEPDSFLQLLPALKYTILFQIAIIWFAAEQLPFKKYITQIVLLTLVLLILGKPYYLAYLIAYSILFLAQTDPSPLSEPKRYKPVLIITVINIYVSFLFPLFSEYTSNQNYSAYLQLRNDYLRKLKLPESCTTYIPVSWSVPFLIRQEQIKIYGPGQRARIVNRAEEGDWIISDKPIVGETSRIATAQHISYSLLMQAKDTVEFGLYIYPVQVAK